LRLLRTITCLPVIAVASGCSLLGLEADPLSDVERLSDVTLAPDVEEAALVAPAEQTSILDDFLSIFQRDAPEDVEPAALVTSDVVEEVDVPDMVVGNIAEVGAEAVVEAPRAGGIFGLLSGLLPDAVDSPDETAAAIPFTPPAFGEMASVCDMAGADLGSRITKVSGYTVYDSAPGSVAIRPHYVTGFNDRCPRRFDAALVLMGDIGTHELVRYSQTRVNLDYSATDEAYETIKARFCGASRGEPCGDRLDRLARNTTFITAYESFGASPQWAEFLLHDGDVAGADIEG